MLRDSGGRIRYGLCSCGERKKLSAALCIDCRKAARLTAALGKLPRPGTFDYFPRDGRYGILAVSGIGARGTIGVTLTVVDSHHCWREVSDLRVPVPHAAARRRDLVAWVNAENRRERRAQA
jgi:hypothetical protein